MEKTWITFQAHFIEAQADLWERHKTSRQGEYHTGTTDNAMEISMEFENLAQSMAEDRAVVINLNTANSNLIEQVALYVNRLSNKEAENMALHIAMKNLQGEVNNLKAEFAILKNSCHSVSAGAANKENGIMTPRWKREGQSRHSAWWSTTYC